MRKLVVLLGVAATLVVAAIIVSAEQSATLETTKVLAGGGDIAKAATGAPLQTANLVKKELAADPTARAATLGDMAYPDGTTANFNQKYHPTWGQFKSKTFPCVGNHEYYSSGTAAPARSYWSSGGAHDLDPTYYSEQLNPALQFICLDSSKGETRKATGAPSCTTQQTFLINELKAATNLGKDTIIAYHHSRFSNGNDHSSDATGCPRLFADAAYDFGGDVVITGHSHLYEDFGYKTKTGSNAAPGTAPYFLVVGTGGANLDGFLANNVTSYNGADGVDRLLQHGILVLTQQADTEGFDYQFKATDGTTKDSGTILSR